MTAAPETGAAPNTELANVSVGAHPRNATATRRLPFCVELSRLLVGDWRDVPFRLEGDFYRDAHLDRAQPWRPSRVSTTEPSPWDDPEFVALVEAVTR